MGCVISKLQYLPYYKSSWHLMISISGTLPNWSGVYAIKMTQYQIILASLKTIIEKQDKSLILVDKVVKFLEHFKPLIDWVRLFFINQCFWNQLQHSIVNWEMAWNPRGCSPTLTILPAIQIIEKYDSWLEILMSNLHVKSSNKISVICFLFNLDKLENYDVPTFYEIEFQLDNFCWFYMPGPFSCC